MASFTMRDLRSLGPPVPSRRCSSGNGSGSCGDTDEEPGCPPPEPVLPYRNSTTPQNLTARLKKSETLPSEGWQTVQWLRRKPSGCSLRSPSEVSTLVQKEPRETSRRTQQPSPPSRPPREPPKPMARLAYLKIDDPKPAPGYSNLPPPLPPKRTSSRPAEYHTEDCSSPLRVVHRPGGHDGRAMRDSRLRGSSSTTSNTPVNESDCSSDSSSVSSNDTDLSAALRKISLRLNQLQVEKSPVLGHYSALYRLDETAWRNQNFSSSSASSAATTPQTWTNASPGTPPYMPRVNARPRRVAYMNLSG